MAVLPQQFGALTPGRRFASATGVTSATAEPIYTKYTIFETVVSGGIAQLPASNASAVELVVLNRGANILSVIPDSGGQIENLGTDTAAGVAVGANATFVCLDPVIAPGRQWWVK